MNAKDRTRYAVCFEAYSLTNDVDAGSYLKAYDAIKAQGKRPTWQAIHAYKTSEDD